MNARNAGGAAVNSWLFILVLATEQSLQRRNVCDSFVCRGKLVSEHHLAALPLVMFGGTFADEPLIWSFDVGARGRETVDCSVKVGVNAPDLLLPSHRSNELLTSGLEPCVFHLMMH